jgi:hypothetical protein
MYSLLAESGPLGQHAREGTHGCYDEYPLCPSRSAGCRLHLKQLQRGGRPRWSPAPECNLRAG